MLATSCSVQVGYVYFSIGSLWKYQYLGEPVGVRWKGMEIQVTRRMYTLTSYWILQISTISNMKSGLKWTSQIFHWK